MPNDFYTPTGNPADNSNIVSADMRAEFAAINAGFNKLPALTGNANKLVVVNSSGTGLDVTAALGIVVDDIGLSTGVGTSTLVSLTTGIQNTAFGYQALRYTTTGSDNAAFGRNAGVQLSGSRNTVIGSGAAGQSGPYSFTGDDNVCIGRKAGVYQAGATSDVDQCVFIGSDSGDVTSTNANAIAIGYQAKPSSTSASNEITLGNASITSFRIPGLSLTATGKTGTNKFVLDTSPTIVTPTLSGNTTVTGGTFASRGLTDNATATALTLSGSGANSVTIANSATNPTIGTSGGSLALGGGAGSPSILAGINAGVDYIAIQGQTSLPYISAAGSSTNINTGISSKGTGSIFFYTNGTAQTQFEVAHVVSADNRVVVQGSAGANSAALYVASGVNTNVGLKVQAKGTGVLELGSLSGAVATLQYGGASYLTMTSGTNASIGTSAGDLVLSPTGNVRFGTYSAAAAEVFAGYITIKDSGGTSRKVMVCA